MGCVGVAQVSTWILPRMDWKLLSIRDSESYLGKFEQIWRWQKERQVLREGKHLPNIYTELNSLKVLNAIASLGIQKYLPIGATGEGSTKDYSVDSIMINSNNYFMLKYFSSDIFIISLFKNGTLHTFSLKYFYSCYLLIVSSYCSIVF